MYILTRTNQIQLRFHYVLEEIQKRNDTMLNKLKENVIDTLKKHHLKQKILSTLDDLIRLWFMTIYIGCSNDFTSRGQIFYAPFAIFWFTTFNRKNSHTIELYKKCHHTVLPYRNIRENCILKSAWWFYQSVNNYLFKNLFY